MSTSPSNTQLNLTKHLSSSILLWIRTDQNRETGMDSDTGVLRELRTQAFMPWHEKLWDTPNVAHDNPNDQRFHASLILGFADPSTRAAFFESREIERLSGTLAPYASAIHAYDVSEALTYVKDGTVLPSYQR